MNKYTDLILKKLLKKYENSKISKGETKRTVNIFIKFDLKEMKDYVSEDSYKYESEILEAVDYLKNKHYICVEEKNHRIQRVILNIEWVDSVYAELHLENPIKKNISYMRQLNQHIDKGQLVHNFCCKMMDKLEHFESVKSYFNSENELRDILITLEYLENQKNEISERNFSAKYLNDSKKLEHMEGKILKIVKECSMEDFTDDSYLEHYNVYKNPTQVYIRGYGIFKIFNQIVDLSKMGNELVLSSNQLKDFSVIELPISKVVTVENLTTYYNIPYKDSCVVYLGGFHNTIRKELLCKIYQFNQNLQFYHCGDIDAGGFYILNHLTQDTKIPFIPYFMDIETLKTYKMYAKKLSDEDRKRLADLMEIKDLYIYYDIFEYMLLHNMKLEQENIIYK